MGTPALRLDAKVRSSYPSWVKERDAAALEREMRAMQQARGTVDAEVMVNESEAESSPYPACHRYLWDKSDAELAKEARLNRAQQIIIHLWVEDVEPRTGTPFVSKPFVAVDRTTNIPVNPERAGSKGVTYLPRRSVIRLHAVELAEVELDQALGELASFVRRFGHLKKLGGVLKAARTTLKKHKRTL